MVRTIGVEAMFAKQYSNTVGPSGPIIQSPIVTSPIAISPMMTSLMVEVAVSVEYDTQMRDDNWISIRINSDNRDFESDENEIEEK